MVGNPTIPLRGCDSCPSKAARSTGANHLRKAAIVTITRRRAAGYRRSLKSWMGYVAETQRAEAWDCSVVAALGYLLSDEGYLLDFLIRYPVRERDRRRSEVVYVVNHWLADIASGANTSEIY